MNSHDQLEPQRHEDRLEELVRQRTSELLEANPKLRMQVRACPRSPAPARRGIAGLIVGLRERISLDLKRLFE